jgi:hypothetical protein
MARRSAHHSKEQRKSRGQKMKIASRGTIKILALSFLLTGCGRLDNAFIESQFYGEKPFVPAGTNTVLPPKLDRVDLFSHIARGDYCVHYRILTGVDFSDLPPVQASGWTVSGILTKVLIGRQDSEAVKNTEVKAAQGRAEALETQSTVEARAKRCKEEVERLTATGTDSNFSVSQRLARAYDEFARAPGKSGEFLTGDEQRQRRGQIQDEVLRASEQRCNTYKLYLQTVQSNASFLSGSASTILGGLGAIFTDSGVSRALAGAAGISAGVGAQFQESYFMSLAVPAISEGIDNGRQTIFKQIRDQRSTDIAGYTLQHALLDAVRYDGACSIPRGLQEVADAARNIRTPGAFVMQRAIDQFAQARQSLNRLSSIESATDYPASLIFGGASNRPDDLSELWSEPTRAIGTQTALLLSYAQDLNNRLIQIAARDKNNYDAIAKIAQTEIDAARSRVLEKIDSATIKQKARDIQVRISDANSKIASSATDIDNKNAAIAELNRARAESRSEIIAPLQADAAAFLSAIDSSRVLSSGMPLDETKKAICLVRDLFWTVVPPNPDNRTKSACSPPAVAAPVAPVIQAPAPPPPPPASNPNG